MSRYYETCPDCGANLDPGEMCDCGETTVIGDKKSPVCAEAQGGTNQNITDIV